MDSIPSTFFQENQEYQFIQSQDASVLAIKYSAQLQKLAAVAHSYPSIWKDAYEAGVEVFNLKRENRETMWVQVFTAFNNTRYQADSGPAKLSHSPTIQRFYLGLDFTERYIALSSIEERDTRLENIKYIHQRYNGMFNNPEVESALGMILLSEVAWMVGLDKAMNCKIEEELVERCVIEIRENFIASGRSEDSSMNVADVYALYLSGVLQTKQINS